MRRASHTHRWIVLHGQIQRCAFPDCRATRRVPRCQHEWIAWQGFVSGISWCKWCLTMRAASLTKGGIEWALKTSVPCAGDPPCAP